MLTCVFLYEIMQGEGRFPVLTDFDRKKLLINVLVSARRTEGFHETPPFHILVSVVAAAFD